MNPSKIKIQYGNASFEAEGDPAWVVEQVDKFNNRIDAGKMSAAISTLHTFTADGSPAQQNTNAAIGNLSSFLITKNATTNQVRKFLVTAEWLTQKGKSTLTTGDVTKALSDFKQSRLGNATECLNRNIGKGFCEKTDGGFFVTPEGRNAIGTTEPSSVTSGDEPDPNAAAPAEPQ